MRSSGDGPVRPVSNGGVVPWSLYVVTLLDMIGVGLVIPLIPAYAKGLGASPSTVGLMGTIYGLAQLIGSSWFGEISDNRGRRHVLQISMLGAACGYALLALAVDQRKSVALLVFSRVPVGIAKQTMTMSRAVVADCTSLADRTRAMSKLAITVGLGFIIGPACGGILSSRSYVGPPVISVCLFVLSFLLVRSMPETAPFAETEEPMLAAPKPQSALKGFKYRKYPQLVFFLGCKSMVTLGYLLLEFSFALYTSQKFGLDPKANGFVLAFAGIVAVLSQGLAVRPLKDRFSDRLLLTAGAATLAAALLGVALAPSLKVFLVAVAVLSLGRAVFRTMCDIIVTQAAAPEDVGVVSGVSDGCDSGCRVMAPVLGGLLIEWYGVASAPAVGGILVLVAMVLMELNVKWSEREHEKRA